MDAVLPLKVSGDFWMEQELLRASLLVKSLAHFWQGVLRLIIISPEQDCAKIDAALSSSENIKIVIVPETDLTNKFGISASRGWLKQQALKLAAYSLVDGPFYLVLDADIICMRPVAEKDLIVNGKALTDWEPRDHHPQWWSSSAAALKIAQEPSYYGLSVTPEILSVEICDNLIKYLNELYDQKGLERLMHLGNENFSNESYSGWTEFSLYNTFANYAGLMDRFHLNQSRMNNEKLSVRVPNNVWFHENFSNITPSWLAKNQESGFFMIVQSNILVHVDDVVNKLKSHLPFIK